MVVADEDPAVQRRRLRGELRTLRQHARLTELDVARALGWSTTKLIRIESDASISSNDLKLLLAYYGVKEPWKVEALLRMGRTARKETWPDYRETHSGPFVTYLGLESSARRIRSYETTLVPGLLQTEEYARAMLSDGFERAESDIDRRWGVRQRRQELHERQGPPEMQFLLEQAVIQRWVGGPGVMRRQLERLKQWSAEPHITLRVIPFAGGMHPGIRGPFALLDFSDPSDDVLLYQEYPSGDKTSRDSAEDTSPYVELFYHLEMKALSSRDTRALLDGIIGEMDEAASPAPAA